METYERLICDLGRRLLTKGLNNDFSESGSDPGERCDAHGRVGVGGVVCVCGFGGRCGLGGTKSSPSTRCVALTVMSPDRHFNKKKNFSL